MALAGFDKKDIEIEFAEGVLTISSVKNEKEVNDNHIWKGISQRQFRRKFTLADEVVVNSATMQNGMLKVELERVIPEAKKPQLIEVK